MPAALPPRIQGALATLEADDRATHGEAYDALVTSPDPVGDWAPAAWVRLLPLLSSKDGRSRSIAGQALCRLARHIPSQDLPAGMPMILAATNDAKFVTARHILLATWRLAVGGGEAQAAYLDWVRARWREALTEKNGALIRHDLVVTLGKLHEAVPEAAVASTGLDLLSAEADDANQKKLAPLKRRFASAAAALQPQG